MTGFENLRPKQECFASIGDLETALGNAIGKTIIVSGNFEKTTDESSSLKFRCTLDSYGIETTTRGTYKFTLDIKDPEALDTNEDPTTDFPRQITLEIGGLNDSFTNTTRSVITSNGNTVNLEPSSGDISDTTTPILPRQEVLTLDQAFTCLEEVRGLESQHLTMPTNTGRRGISTRLRARLFPTTPKNNPE